uniref:Uncharacterized protein n=1 Tax=Arundo donax TaxID=35708 RepID=A0A0A9CAZ9_ARUDO
MCPTAYVQRYMNKEPPPKGSG